MIVRDLFNELDPVRVIARAIFEDRTKEDEVDVWIRKYYSQFIRLKNTKTHKSNMMIAFTISCEKHHFYGDISGIEYDDIESGKITYYAIEFSSYKEYASIYVPSYSLKRYGKEVVAAEILREYGWNGHDERITCPKKVQDQIIEALRTMESGLFPEDQDYIEKCITEFKLFYEGRKHKCSYIKVVD